MKADDSSPIHSITSHHSARKSHRTADAPPDITNCPTQSSRREMELIRQRRSTVVRRSTDIPALGQPHEERERGGSRNVGAANVVAENVPGRAIHNLLLLARTDNQREELRAFLVAILDVAPSTRLQYGRMLRSMLEMDRTPLDMMILGFKKLRRDWEQSRCAHRQRKGWINLSAAGPIGRNVLFFDLRGRWRVVGPGLRP
ncbi:SH3 domain protein [Trypanosoma cruzi]|nr:SH3 domain protein [Trypanosoma cruzi]